MAGRTRCSPVWATPSRCSTCTATPTSCRRTRRISRARRCTSSRRSAGAIRCTASSSTSSSPSRSSSVSRPRRSRRSTSPGPVSTRSSWWRRRRPACRSSRRSRRRCSGATSSSAACEPLKRRVAAPEPIVVAGSSPVVLVAPHGGQRDYDGRPWGSAPLKVNDLHTAALTQELAAVLDASAVINAALDRNDVDLNRVSAAHTRAPAFLERLADVLAATIARHGRATVLTVHGWNVIQPAVDLGFGCSHGAAVDRAAAVSPAFAATALPALVGACAAHGITATTGARYPARARENLVQLFTPRYRDDSRPLVRQLATLGTDVDAVQLELAVPLRWPGAWRRKLVDACRDALPALVDGGSRAPATGVTAPSPTPVLQRALQVVGRGASTLVALDEVGARLLIFPPGGGLAHFTGERTGGEERGRVAGLRMDEADDGTLRVRFAGPMMRFPDTTPFLDLERGLGGASVIADADVELVFEPAHPGADGSDFGSVRGTARLDGEQLDLGGRAFST